MRRELINIFPTWSLFFLVCAALIVFALIVYKVSRRYFPSYLMSGGLNLSNLFMNVITINTMLLAFTIVVLWQFFEKTTDAVNSEASSLAEIIIYSKALDPDEQHRINKAVSEYIKLVVDTEWKLMRKGESSIEAESALKNIYVVIEEYSPTSENQRLFFQQALSSYNKTLDARSARLNAVNSTIPNTFFFVIVANLLMLIAAICLIDEKNKKAEFVFIIYVSIIVGLNLSLIMIMDFPFSGQFSISSAPLTGGLLESIYNVA
jgi:hypothetical protein